MALTDVEAVRLKISDKPAFEREEKQQQETGVTYFRLDYRNVQASPAIIVRKNGSIQTLTTHYTVDAANGGVTLVTAPTVGDDLIFEYYHVAFTDEQLDHFITETGHVTLAAAAALLAWAAEVAHSAQKLTLAGGGGIGSVTIASDMRARELRASAEAYYKRWQVEVVDYSVVEMLTEIPWTDWMVERQAANWLLDNT